MIRRLLAREEAGMADLLLHYGPLMRYIIAPILPNPQDREDCLSEISLRIWARIGGYTEDRGTLAAWLTAIARNAALNHLKARLRREKHQPEEPPEVLTPEQEVLRRERAEQLRDTVAKLPDLDRKIFYRRYYYLQPVSQIAAELGLSQRAVEGRLYRLRNRLRQELGGDDT